MWTHDICKEIFSVESFGNPSQDQISHSTRASTSLIPKLCETSAMAQQHQISSPHDHSWARDNFVLLFPLK